MKDEKFELGEYKLRLFLYRKRWAIEIKKGKAKNIKSLKTKDHEMAIDEFYKYKLELKEKGRLNIIFDTDIFRQIEIFLNWSNVNSNSKNTYESHKTSMRIIREFISKKKVNKINHKMYEDFKAYLLAKGNAPRTLDLRLTAIIGMITALENMEFIPLRLYPKPKLIRAKKVMAPKF